MQKTRQLLGRYAFAPRLMEQRRRSVHKVKKKEILRKVGMKIDCLS